jgi:fructose-1-phosphate kinase PfkB-like protein
MSSSALFVSANLAIDDLLRHNRKVLGGGNINAARAYGTVAQLLGLDRRPQTLAFVGESDRDNIRNLTGVGVNPGFIAVRQGQLRVNRITMGTDGEEQTLYGESTLKIEAADIERMLGKICRAEPGSWVALTGSLPPGMTVEFFVEVIRLLQRLDVGVVLDTRGHLLKAILELGCWPGVIKPNKDELELLVGEEIRPHDDTQLLYHASRLLPRPGIVVVSLGRDGVFVYYDGHAWRMRAELPTGASFVTANGCGDSLVGGMLAGLSVAGIKSGLDDVVKAASLGVAAGVANIASAVPGEIDLELLRAILSDHLVVKQVA